MSRILFQLRQKQNIFSNLIAIGFASIFIVLQNFENLLLHNENSSC